MFVDCFTWFLSQKLGVNFLKKVTQETIRMQVTIDVNHNGTCYTRVVTTYSVPRDYVLSVGTSALTKGEEREREIERKRERERERNTLV